MGREAGPSARHPDAQQKQTLAFCARAVSRVCAVACRRRRPFPGRPAARAHQDRLPRKVRALATHPIG
eukprot:3579008-Pleurochrysis_carterae.AAC.1